MCHNIKINKTTIILICVGNITNTYNRKLALMRSSWSGMEMDGDQLDGSCEKRITKRQGGKEHPS